MGILLDIVNDEQLCEMMCGKPEDDMKYIIMAGTNTLEYREFRQTPRQCFPIKGEPNIARTIRLLQEAGIDNIAISSNDKTFEKFGVPLLHHENKGRWVNGFYPTNEPACYIFGDVVFSKGAIETIVNVITDDIEFFASSPPFSREYTKKWAEPFAFKVQDQDHFREAINKTIEIANAGKFRRDPIAWELWQVIKGTPINQINYKNYCIINDWTCDIDEPYDAALIQSRIEE